MRDQSNTDAGRSARGGLTVLSSLAIALAVSGVARSFGRTERPGDGSRSARLAGRDETSSRSPHAAAREPGRGREATAPTEIPPRGWWDIARRVFDEIGRDRILAVAAGVTFYGLLALFPAIAAFVSLYGLVADPATINDHLTAMSGLLPGGAVDIIGEQVKRITSNETALGFAFFSGLAISIWSANAGMKAVFDALNVAYEEEEKRNFFWLNVWSLGFTFATVLFLCLALASVVVLPAALDVLGLGVVAEWVVWAGRWPAMLLLLMLGLAALYRFGPSRDRAQWAWLTPGAMFAAVTWLVASMLFSWYVSNFGSYNETYGSLGAIIGFMTWMWISSIIILVGAELNAETEHQTARDTTDGPHAPLGARGAHVADTVGEARS